MLSTITTQLVADACERGARLRPPVGGFPYLAESLREAGVRSVHCDVPSWTTTYRTAGGAVVDQGSPLVEGYGEVAPFDRDALVETIRRDQAGETTFPELIAALWRAGVLTYDVDLAAHTCTYCGTNPGTETYVEHYPAVTLEGLS